MFRTLFCILILSLPAFGQNYRPIGGTPPMVPREFRAAWVASVYNIDWPSRIGLSAAAQQAEMRALLDRMASMRMNAVIFQVRPNADAVYASSIEPWSHWISGRQGVSPGYDPLAYCIQQAHARGLKCTPGSIHTGRSPMRICQLRARTSSRPTHRSLSDSRPTSGWIHRAALRRIAPWL